MTEMTADTQKHIIHDCRENQCQVEENLAEFYKHFTHETLRTFYALYATITNQKWKKQA